MNLKISNSKGVTGGGEEVEKMWLGHELDLDIALCSLTRGWPFNEIPIENRVQKLTAQNQKSRQRRSRHKEGVASQMVICCQNETLCDANWDRFVALF